MIKKLFDKYFKLIKRVNERHYWPLFIFLSLYFVVPYSEYVVTALIFAYFQFESQFRKIGARLIKPFPEWMRVGGGIIFFLVMLDDTIAYLSVLGVAMWSNRELKRREKEELKQQKEDEAQGLM